MPRRKKSLDKARASTLSRIRKFGSFLSSGGSSVIEAARNEMPKDIGFSFNAPKIGFSYGTPNKVKAYDPAPPSLPKPVYSGLAKAQSLLNRTPADEYYRGQVEPYIKSAQRWEGIRQATPKELRPSIPLQELGNLGAAGFNMTKGGFKFNAAIGLGTGVLKQGRRLMTTPAGTQPDLDVKRIGRELVGFGRDVSKYTATPGGELGKEGFGLTGAKAALVDVGAPLLVGHLSGPKQVEQAASAEGLLHEMRKARLLIINLEGELKRNGVLSSYSKGLLADLIGISKRKAKTLHSVDLLGTAKVRVNTMSRRLAEGTLSNIPFEGYGAGLTRKMKQSKVDKLAAKSLLSKDLDMFIMDRLGSSYGYRGLNVIEQLDQGYSVQQIKKAFPNFHENFIKNAKKDLPRLRKKAGQKGFSSLTDFIRSVRVGAQKFVYSSTKQESTDFYNQATKELEPFAKEARKYSWKALKKEGKLFDGNKLTPEGRIAYLLGIIEENPIDIKEIKYITGELPFPKRGVGMQGMTQAEWQKALNIADSVRIVDRSKAYTGISGSKIEPTVFEGKFKDFYNQATKGDIRAKVPTGISGEMSAEESKYAASINKTRLNISKEAKGVVDRVTEAIKPELEEIKGGKLTNKEVIEAAQKSEVLRRVVSKEQTKRATATITRLRQAVSAGAEGEGITKEFVENLKSLNSFATDAGRRLQAFKIGADSNAATIKEALLKDMLKLDVDTNKIIKASKGVNFDNPKEVTAFYRQFVKPNVSEIINEYRYANMLSSPQTHIINAFSNLVQATVLNPATKLYTGGIDFVGSKLTGGAQQQYVSEVPAYYRGMLNSVGEATEQAIKAFKGEVFVERPDINRLSTGVRALRPFRYVLQALEAGDVYFRTLIRAGEEESLALRNLKSGSKLPPELIKKQAEENAAYWIFRKALDPQNKAGQGRLLSYIDTATSAVYKFRNVPGVGWFIPFVQTPMNILKQGIEFSPAGLATLPGAVNKQEQLAKTLVGSTVMAGSAWLTMVGDGTWSAPRNKKDKEAFYASGRQPYSIKIGDKWVSYSRLGPLAYPIAMAAAVKYYTKQDPKAHEKSTLEQLGSAFAGIAGFFSDQSYMQGLGDLVKAVQGDEYYLQRALSNVPRQLVPLTALQGWVARIIDPVYRKPENPAQAVISGIPFLSERVPPYTNPLGEPSKRQYPRFNAVSPARITKESSQFERLYQDRQEAARVRSLGRKAKKELKSGGVTTTTSGKLLYFKGDGNIGEIDLSKGPAGVLGKQDVRDRTKKIVGSSELFDPDSGLTEELARQAVETIGGDFDAAVEDVFYKGIKSLDTDLKLQVVREGIITPQGSNPDQLYLYLEKGVINKSNKNKILAPLFKDFMAGIEDPENKLALFTKLVKDSIITNAFIDELLETGEITPREATMLRNARKNVKNAGKRRKKKIKKPKKIGRAKFRKSAKIKLPKSAIKPIKLSSNKTPTTTRAKISQARLESLRSPKLTPLPNTELKYSR